MLSIFGTENWILEIGSCERTLREKITSKLYKKENYRVFQKAVNKKPFKKTITLEMADKWMSEFCVVFTMSLCVLELKFAYLN